MQAYEERDYFLTLIEISIQELEHVDGELHGEVWPGVLPPVDGVFCLYDASDRSSFIHVEELISKSCLPSVDGVLRADHTDCRWLLRQANTIYSFGV